MIKKILHLPRVKLFSKKNPTRKSGDCSTRILHDQIIELSKEGTKQNYQKKLLTAVSPIPDLQIKTQQKEYWTTSYFEDRFFLDLTKVTHEIKIIGDNGLTTRVIRYRKYYRQAISKMYRIPLTEQHPKSKEEAVIFNIHFSDLSHRVQEELLDYCRLYDKKHVTILLKQVVIRLFENLDFDYAHMSVIKKLRVSVIREVNKIG